jgi:hypothetical protein
MAMLEEYVYLRIFRVYVNKARIILSAEKPQFHGGFVLHDIVHCIPAQIIEEDLEFGSANIEIGPMYIERPCWTSFCVAFRKSVVLTRPSKLASVGDSTIGATK